MVNARRPGGQKWLSSLSVILIALLLNGKIRAEEEETTTAPESYANDTSTAAPTEAEDGSGAGEAVTTSAPPEEQPTVTSTEDPYMQYSHNQEPFEVIDVAGHASNDGSKSSAGETTKIYTTGDVNDDFWLKHLGDDFKNAIHLQVGGGAADPYEQAYNSSKYGMPEVHHEFVPPQAPTYPGSYLPTRGHYYADSEAANSQIYRGRQLPENAPQQPAEAANESPQENREAKDSSPRQEENVYGEKNFEAEFKLDDNGINNIARKFYNSKVFEIPDSQSPKSGKYSSPKKYSKLKTKEKKFSQKLQAKSFQSTSEFPPVVVNLPDTATTVVESSDKDETPLVVKMPPVIYHSSPTYQEEEKDSYGPSESNQGSQDSPSYSNGPLQSPSYSQMSNSYVPQNQNSPYQYQSQYTPHYSQQAQYSPPPPQHTQTQNQYQRQQTQNTPQEQQYNSPEQSQTQAHSHSHSHPQHQSSYQSSQSPHSPQTPDLHLQQRPQSPPITADQLAQSFNKFKTSSLYNPPPFEDHSYLSPAQRSYMMSKSSGSGAASPTSSAAGTDLFGASSYPSHLSYNGYTRATRSSRDIFYSGL